MPTDYRYRINDRAAVRVDGIKQLSRKLERLGFEAQDFKPLWTQLMGQYWYEAVQMAPVSKPRKGQPPPGRFQRSIKTFKQKYKAGLYIRRNYRMRYQGMVYYGGRGHRGKPYVNMFEKIVIKHRDDILREANQRVDDLVRRARLK